MPFAQNSYTKNTSNAFAGLVSDISHYNIESFTNETGVIGFGLGVQFGTGQDEAILGSGVTGSNFLGVSVRQTAKENSVVGAEEEFYTEKETMGVLRKGNIWVSLAAGGNPGDTIRVDNATGILDVGGIAAGFSVIGALQTVTVPGALGLLRLDKVT